MKPCAFYDWDEAAARDRLTYPVEECENKCGSCGFNPTAAEKRIERVREEWQKRQRECRQSRCEKLS